MEQQEIKIGKLLLNDGQLPDIPKNPRFIRDEAFEQLKQSIKDYPDMLAMRELVVVPYNDKYVVLGGNMRLRACRELGYKSLPCKVYPADTDPKVLRHFVLVDNKAYGEDDWDALANEWDEAELAEWGIEVPSFEGMGEKEKIGKDEEVEQLLNEAMVDNIREYVEQVKLTMEHGFIETGLTRGYAKAQFLKALHYGGRYPQKCAYVYAPELYVLRNKVGENYLTQMHKIIAGDKCGIAGFRTLTNDDKLTRTISSQYRVGGGGGGGDFPADKAKDIYLKYGGEGCKVLDPCHGWGGRLVGAMLAGVNEYYGCDPSPIANRAVSEIFADFKGYCHTTATLIKKPYESITNELPTDFDMAFTSPPYFDVEHYDGEETSTTLYPEFEKWCCAFYTPLITETVKRLKEGGAFLLQVGSQSYPLKERAMQICNDNGLVCEIVESDMFFSTLGTEDRSDKEELLEITKK